MVTGLNTELGKKYQLISMETVKYIWKMLNRHFQFLLSSFQLWQSFSSGMTLKELQMIETNLIYKSDIDRHLAE